MPLDTADFWVQLHDLPLGFFSEKAAKAIGNFIGEYLCIDEAAFKRNFDASLRAPNRRPSPVTGNRWVVMSEQPDHKTTSNHFCQGEDVVARTCTEPGQNRKDNQSTTCPLAQHVAPNSGTHPTSNGTVRDDVTMEQIDSQLDYDALVILDPKPYSLMQKRLLYFRQGVITCRCTSRFCHRTPLTPELASVLKVCG
nr:uncharacterized protein LOC109173053 [Ipomoea batatas]